MADTMAPSAPAQARSLSVQELCINAIRILSMDAVQKANSGHPGTPMALAPLAYTLWTRHMRYDPADPEWINRDRFVLSAGHASMLLYSVLYLTGYDLSLDDLKQFRQWESATPGHPEYGYTPGVETTTGPLGQGIGNAVGMAIAEAHLAATFNRPGHEIIDHRTYFIASDGDMMEGVSHEAASLAGHLRLGKLIGFYDDNHITIEGSTDLAFNEDVGKRFAAYGWHVQRVEDANDVDALDRAITQAEGVVDRPSLVIVRSHIAYGAPHAVDTAEAHGAPLGEEEIRFARQNLGWPSEEPFVVPEEALRAWRQCRPRGAELHAAWLQKWGAFAREAPDAVRELERRLARELPDQWDRDIPSFPTDKKLATRAASEKVLNAIAPRLPELMGGSADLAPSTKTLMKDAGDFEAGHYAARNMHFGIREHAMGAVLNGMALHGGILPYGATFLIFSDYMRPPIRLAAIMQQHVIYVFTHDSIGLGEDGPTHQPIEQLAALRVIPHLTVIRPADASETAEAWRVAIAHGDGPVALALTRQNLPVLDRGTLAPAAGLAHGAYILSDTSEPLPDAVLMASGSEVHIVLAAQETLRAHGVSARVVSMPSMELFAAQPAAYRDEVLPPAVRTRVAVEAAHPMPWRQWVGDAGEVIGLTHFGASAPYERLYQEFGLTPDDVVGAVLRLRGRVE
ncbi:MAG TPA: transketolase [Gemmatimonadaceae bacterium]|nr:transketolase [Gemmatimonadaceae bacterium]